MMLPAIIPAAASASNSPPEPNTGRPTTSVAKSSNRGFGGSVIE
jgi:hypothetical protein